MNSKKIGFVVPLMFILSLIMFSRGAYAHPPQDMVLEYNISTSELDVTITHNSPAPTVHYVYKIDVQINNELFLSQQYTSQPTTSTFTYTYIIPTNATDEIKVTAFCIIAGSISKTLIVPSENAPLAPEIDGPKTGKADTNYEYTITTIDPDNNDLYLYITWGDGTNSGWIGPYNSGETVKQSHSWSNEGTYNINAKAKDTNENEGPTGTFEVSIPRNKSAFSNLIQKYIQILIDRFLILKNLIIN